MIRALLLHNYYQQSGGEDQVFACESNLLEDQGHAIQRYIVHNNEVPQLTKLALGKATLWNDKTYQELRNILKRECPDVVHIHNTFPLISPAAYYAAKAEGVAVVQTLHNYRLLCLNAIFFRDGHICEDCMGKAIPWPGVAHACYRDSHTASAVVAAMLTFHRLRNTWTEMVDIYVTLTHFSKHKFIEGGLPAEKIVIKPNFLASDPGLSEGYGNYALFVGRLSEEKGLSTLLAAWKKLKMTLPLKIVGDGPLASQVEEAARQMPNVEWLGHKSPHEVHDLMGKATMLIFPSECYETFGRVAIEAFAKGTPVIAANIGAIAEVVEHGCTGLHFRPGDPDDLAAQVEWALTHPTELAQMRKRARAEFEANYTAERNYQLLMDIYERAISSQHKASG